MRAMTDIGDLMRRISLPGIAVMIVGALVISQWPTIAAAFFPTEQVAHERPDPPKQMSDCQLLQLGLPWLVACR